MDQYPIDMQAAFAVTALAAALCKQPGINGQQLRLDLLEALEGIGGSPAAVGDVGKQIAGLMDDVLKGDHGSPRPPAGK